MTEGSRTPLRVLSAGAAKRVVQVIAGAFERESGIRVDATFDSAGAIAQAFAAEPASGIVILPLAMQNSLANEGCIDVRSIAALGHVPTGIAIRSGEQAPAVADADALRTALRSAPALYCPDTSQSTAGIHFAGVLRALGIHESSMRKLHRYPNGARAMAALADERRSGAIGCTQITEILYTPGVILVAPLPSPFELTTVYAIAVSSMAAMPEVSRAFAVRLTDSDHQPLLRAAGFLSGAN